MEYLYLLEGRDGAPWYQKPIEWQEQRFRDICQIPWGRVDFIRRLLQEGRAVTKISSRQIDIIDPKTIPSLTGFSPEESQRYEERGERLIREGALARVTLAAGEAARFRGPGDDRPKALIEIADKTEETYLSVQARDILLAQYLNQTVVPWVLFVHPAYREAFEKYLSENNYFALDPESVALIEHTGIIPKFTGSGKIATAADMTDGDPNDERIAFGTEGHGFFATAFRNNPIFISGRRLETTAYEWLKQRGTSYIFQANIDNLGARISTHDYKITLGFYYEREREEGYQILVELTTP